MGKYRKKPVEIEAFQFIEETKDRVYHWIDGNKHAGPAANRSKQ